MRTGLMLFGIALLGVFGADRLSEAQESGTPQTGMPATRQKLPPIDSAVAAKTETATFALG